MGKKEADKDGSRAKASVKAAPSLSPSTIHAPLSRSAAMTLLGLQRTHGNRYVQRLISRAGDSCEREGAVKGGEEAPAEVREGIQRAHGGGQPLEAGVRARMESAFDSDFGGVRLHTDERADALSRGLDALAFTTGHDIFFRRGGYDPHSHDGLKTLIHELTHVLQQGEGGASAGEWRVSDPADGHEREADAISEKVMSVGAAGRSAPEEERVPAHEPNRAAQQGAGPTLVQRKEETPAAATPTPTPTPTPKKKKTPAEIRAAHPHQEPGPQPSSQELRNLLMKDITKRGGLTVAVYIGDESGKSHVFRKEAHKFAIDHEALGWYFPVGLLRGKPMEMTDHLPDQLEAITEEAKEVLQDPALGTPYTGEVWVKTLAIFTHGWEAGVRAKVNPEKDVFSTQKTGGLQKVNEKYEWFRKIGAYMDKSPNIVLYACRTGGDADVKYAKVDDPSTGEPDPDSKPSVSFSKLRKDAEGVASGSNLHIKEGMPFAAQMREGIEQGILERERREHPDAVAYPNWIPRIYLLAPPDFWVAWEMQKRGIDVNVWAHLDKGHATASNRWSQFTANPQYTSFNAAGRRISFPHVLAISFLMKAMEGLKVGKDVIEGKPYTMSQWESATEHLGSATMAPGKVVTMVPKEKGSKEMVKKKGDYKQHQLTFVREIPFMGIEKTIGILTAKDDPTADTFIDLPLSAEARARLAEGAKDFRKDYAHYLEEQRKKFVKKMGLAKPAAQKTQSPQLPTSQQPSAGAPKTVLPPVNGKKPVVIEHNP